MQPRKCVFAFTLVACLLLAVPAFSQVSGGTISGVVTDQTGATIPGATVTVRNLDTNVERTATTESDGRFSFPGLLIGRYEIKVALAGFGTYIRGPIVLTVGQNAVINPELRPAAVAETVTVTEDAPVLNTTNAEVGVRFDERRISDLPLSGSGYRDVFSLALSAPGVSQTNVGNSGFASGVNFSTNGMRLRSNNFTIDGQDSNDPSVTGRQQAVNNPDIVKEFRLVTNQFDAEFGRAAGAVVQVITKSGTNDFHGSAFWFYNGQWLNALTNLEKAKYTSAPFRDEDQYGGTIGGPFYRNHTWGFGSFQRWTQRWLSAGAVTLKGAPTDAGRQILQSTVGTRPQVQALLTFLPPADTPLSGTGSTAAFCLGGGSLTTTPPCVGGQKVVVPLVSLTGSASPFQTNTQWTTRVDQRITQNHNFFGRFMFSDTTSGGTGQVTPSGLTSQSDSRTMAMAANLTSTLTPKLLNVFQASWQRLSTTTSASDPASETIPSLEITPLGMTGFNAADSRTALGLAVNLPQYRFNNTYQLQETISWVRGPHAMKFGLDFRRVDVKSFFVPTTRGLLRYAGTQLTAAQDPTRPQNIQTFIDDIAEAANINKALPGGRIINYYRWYDYYFFVQDTWQIHPTFSLNYGIRYETPGNTIASLIKTNQKIVETNGGRSVFLLNPRPDRDLNNWQPRFGFSWNPRTSNEGWLGWITGGDQFVLRGGYSRTNDYAFLNIALNIASAFPFMAAINNTNLASAWTTLPTLTANLSNDAALNLLTRTVVGSDFRSPIAEQFALEVQRGFLKDYSVRIGWVATKGTALYQTIDGNPRTQCNPVPATRSATTGAWTISGCPRVNPLAGVIRLRANAASSVYHSMQVQLDKRFSRGFSAGLHYTWSAFIDTASEIFNPSVAGEVAVAQNSFDRRADRGRSTYDRPHRLSTNFVWELPWFRSQQGALGRVAGGWQVGTFATFQSGSPFSALNGADPAAVLGGIDGLVGNSVRPNLNTSLNIFSMSLEEILEAGGRDLFSPLPSAFVGGSTVASNCTLNPGSTTAGTCDIPLANRYGLAGRNILRSDGIGNIDLSILKTTNITESHRIQFRADFLNMTNTRNFGIPEARVSAAAFGDQSTTNGGSRFIYLSLKYLF